MAWFCRLVQKNSVARMFTGLFVKYMLQASRGNKSLNRIKPCWLKAVRQLGLLFLPMQLL